MTRAITLALIFLLPAPVIAQSERATKLVLGAYLTAAFADTSITSWAIGNGTAHEANPFLRPIVEQHGVTAAMAVKGGMHAGITFWLLRDNQQHPKRAFWTAVGLTAAQVAVDALNVRTVRKRP